MLNSDGNPWEITIKAEFTFPDLEGALVWPGSSHDVGECNDTPGEERFAKVRHTQGEGTQTL